MQTDSTAAMLKQLDAVLAYRDELVTNSIYKTPNDLTGVALPAVRKGITMAVAAIERIAGTDSPYLRQAKEIEKRQKELDLQYIATELFGVVDALRTDVSAGYLRPLRELIHGSLFANFLEMARHLADEGYKDAAAVIVGSSLEVHLRQLCQKHGIDIVVSGKQAPRPKKAELMNTDLATANAYSGLDQKNVTAWLALRNEAAHGQYDNYKKEQVELMISAVQDFISRISA